MFSVMFMFCVIFCLFHQNEGGFKTSNTCKNNSQCIYGGQGETFLVCDTISITAGKIACVCYDKHKMQYFNAYLELNRDINSYCLHA